MKYCDDGGQLSNSRKGTRIKLIGGEVFSRDVRRELLRTGIL